MSFKFIANQYRKRACDGKSRPLLDGEKHIGCHNFTGPHTRIDLPEVRNFKPYNGIDACSKQHDLDYNNTKDLAGIEKKRAIRKADIEVLACYEKHQKDSGYTVAKTGIKSKMLAEGLVPDLVEKIAGPEYTGGKKKAKKANPWLQHVAKVRKANPGLSYKDVLKKAKLTYA